MSTINGFTNTMRITGMATGMDTDQIVSDLMKVERAPLDRLYQQKQLAEWKRDAYRDITNSLRSFQSEYMDYLNSTTNMLSSTSYKNYSSTVVDSTGATSSIASVSASANAVTGSHTIRVDKLATADQMVSSSGVTKDLKSTAAITDTLLSGKTIKVTLDGVTREIALDDYTDVNDLVNKAGTGLQDLLDTAFGSGKITVSVDGGTGIQFTTSNSKLTLGSGTTNDGLSALQINSGSSNRLNTNQSLGALASNFANPLTFAWDADDYTQSTADIDVAGTTWKDKTFNVTVDGVTKKITIDDEPVPADINGFATKLNTLIDTAFGADNIDVNVVGNQLKFDKGSEDIGYFTLHAGDEDTNALADMNIDSNTTASGHISFTINDKEFTIEGNKSLASMMSTINGDSTAKVQMSYDEVSDTFKLTATQLGAGDNINISTTQEGNFFGVGGAININTGNTVDVEGEDAKLVINPGASEQILYRSSNTITANGVTYNLNRADASEVLNVSLTMDTDKAFENIVGFVEKYNEMIATINDKLSEDYDRDYQPLTAEEKEAMSEDDLKLWEEKAKTGLLRRDSMLEKITTEMRRALYEPVDGESTTLASIGITTGTYTDKGKLIIDEDELKDALQNNADGVMNLFSKSSSISYSRTLSSADRNTRYQEQGLVHRLSDIINDNISTFRDSNGNKGTLLEKAGMPGDGSEIKNYFYEQIKDYEDAMERWENRLADKEESYYSRFAAMESAIQQMNAQSSWLASQFSTGG